MKPIPAALVATAFALLAGSLRAETPAPSGVVSLTASASVEVAKDMLQVVFSTTKDGSDAASVQAALKQALDAALAEAKKVARPEQIEVQTGNFSLYPRYGSKGQPSGWQGTAELLVEGKDMAGIAQLTGRISTLTIGRVGYGLSKEQREKAEAEVTAQAIANYRARAAEYAKQFGYGGYTIREVSVNANEPVMYAPAPALRAKTMSMAADEVLPVEPGKGTVTVSVSGTVQMK